MLSNCQPLDAMHNEMPNAITKKIIIPHPMTDDLVGHDSSMPPSSSNGLENTEEDSRPQDTG